MRDEMHKVGYDQEEQYFHKLNQELIERHRARLDAERQAQEAANRRAAHWLKCPKCGDDMAEVELRDIKIDRCKGCQGVFFDRGELDLLFEAEVPDSLFGWLKKQMFQ